MEPILTSSLSISTRQQKRPYYSPIGALSPPTTTQQYSKNFQNTFKTLPADITKQQDHIERNVKLAQENTQQTGTLRKEAVEPIRKTINNPVSNSAITTHTPKIPKMDIIVGNPPYQNEKSRPIFQHFQENSLKIAKNTTLVYMASRWWYGTAGLEQYRTETIPNKRLESVIYYDILETSKMVFPGTLINGGINIVTFNDKQNNFFKLTENRTNHTIELPHTTSIEPIKASGAEIAKTVQKVMKKMELITLHDRNQLGPYSIRLTGQEIQQLNPRKTTKETLPKTSEMKMFANISGTKKGTSDYYIMDKPDGKTPNTNYKVCMGQSLVENENRNLRLFLFDTATEFGRSSYSLAQFETKQEAENFKKYASTKFFEYLLRLSLAGRSKTIGLFIPDLKNYTKTNPLFQTIQTTAQLNQKLLETFGMNTEQQKLINQTRPST